MADEAEQEVPDGTAVFPLIPPELGVNPLLLAVIHATVFLAGSDEHIVDAAAADEAVEVMAGYLQRLNPGQVRQVQEDMDCLSRFAKQQQWPKQIIRAIQTFLEDYGIEEGGTD